VRGAVAARAAQAPARSPAAYYADSTGTRRNLDEIELSWRRRRVVVNSGHDLIGVACDYRILNGLS
jgi:hypothetical protein